MSSCIAGFVLFVILKTFSSVSEANEINNFVNWLLFGINQDKTGVDRDINIYSPDGLEVFHNFDLKISGHRHLENILEQINSTARNKIHSPQLTIISTQNLTIISQILLQLFSNTKIERTLTFQQFFFLFSPIESHLINYDSIIRKLFSDVNSTSINNDIYFVQISNKTLQQNYCIWELYKVDNHIVVRKIEIISTYPKLEFLFSKVARRTNFEKAAVRAGATTNLQRYLEHTIVQVNGRVTFINGSAVNLINDIRDILNFTLVALIGESISSHTTNGSLKGNTFDRLQNGQLDIFISRMSLQPSRAKNLQFLQPTYSARISVFFVQPPVSSIRNMFVSPLTPYLWMAMILAWLFIILNLVGISYLLKRNSLLSEVEDVSMIKESLLWAVGTISQQSWHYCPSSTSLRIVLISGSLMGLLCYLAYSAVIVSALSVKKIPIQSINALLKSDLQLYSDNRSTTVSDLLKFIEYRSVSKTMGSNSNKGLERDDAIKSIYDKNPLAFLSYSHDTYNTIRKLCIKTDWFCNNLHELTVTTFPIQSGMVVPKNSPYAEFFNYQIMWLKEIGLNHRYIRGYDLGNSISCLPDERLLIQVIVLDDVFSAYAVLAFGFLVSLISLFCEICVTKWVKNSKAFLK